MSNKITAKSMVGKKYNRLLVLAVTELRDNLKIVVLCHCDCGTERHFVAANVARGNSKSCGCLGKEPEHNGNFKHGGSHTPEFSVWKDLINRCNNPTNKNFHDYGGRGIKVCARWLKSFENFYVDMGPRPSKSHSIDRFPNNNGNYDPRNCRWATQAQQNSNTRRNIYYEHDGKRMILNDWAKFYGLGYMFLYNRLRAGWSFADAISRPTRVFGYEVK